MRARRSPVFVLSRELVIIFLFGAEPFLFKHSANEGGRSSNNCDDDQWRNPGDHHLYHHFEQDTSATVQLIGGDSVQYDTDAEHGAPATIQRKAPCNDIHDRHHASKPLQPRNHIDPDCERLSAVFQAYFETVEDCFVFINWRLDFSGILITDLKKALVRLRVVRDRPFSCFFKTVYGYNFSRYIPQVCVLCSY
jgi:hypothetical protein